MRMQLSEMQSQYVLLHHITIKVFLVVIGVHEGVEFQFHVY